MLLCDGADQALVIEDDGLLEGGGPEQSETAGAAPEGEAAAGEDAKPKGEKVVTLDAFRKK